MPDDNLIERMLEALKEKVREAKELYWALEQLKKYGGDFDLPSLATLFSIEATASTATTSIRRDEFHRRKHTEATEQYLRKVGHAMSLDEIYNALVEGGAEFTGDGKKSLNVQLTRATRKFSKIGSGRDISFGLLEWYPKRKGRMIRVEDSSGEESELPFMEDTKKEEKE